MEELLKHCVAAFSQSGGLLTVFFLAGLTGGFTHCLVMCGTNVAVDAVSCGGKCAVSCTKIKNNPKISGLFRASGVFYHFGRMTTYGLLGFFSAFLSKQIATFPIWHFISGAMLAAAGAMFILSSLPNCTHLLLKSSDRNSYLRGVLLGFMPCGLLYAALMMAATTASPFLGMFAMWIFVFGTIPALLIANIGAKILTDRRQAEMRKLGRLVMVFNGLSLLVMASKMFW